MITTVCRKERFNAAHRLYREDWSDERNNQVFGICSRPNFHGHNYTLIAKVTGEVDPETGYLMDLKDLKDIIRSEVIEAFDHRNLNLDTEEFKKLNPTAENIAFVIWHKLKDKLDPKFQLSITLYETDRNFVEYHGK